MFEAQKTRVKDLAKRFLPGKARWYPKLRHYIKRFEVVLAEVGVVQLLIVWKAQEFGWHLTTLSSTLKAGIQDVFKAWSARWSLEVSRGLRKQNLALGACKCLTYAAHLQHAELVNRAFELMRQEWQRTPRLTWKSAQHHAAETLKNALLCTKPGVATAGSRLAVLNHPFSTAFQCLATSLLTHHQAQQAGT